MGEAKRRKTQDSSFGKGKDLDGYENIFYVLSSTKDGMVIADTHLKETGFTAEISERPSWELLVEAKEGSEKSFNILNWKPNLKPKDFFAVQPNQSLSQGEMVLGRLKKDFNSASKGRIILLEVLQKINTD